MSDPPRLLDRVRAARPRAPLQHSHRGGVRRLDPPLHPLSPQAASFGDGSRGGQRLLTHLATEENVAAATQAQALSALLFLYKHVLVDPLPWLDDIVRARKPRRLPVVMTRDEVRAVLGNLEGTQGLVVSLLYGGGLRLLEALHLRVKDRSTISLVTS